MDKIFGREFPSGIIGDHASSVKKRIIDQLKPGDVLIDSYALKEITPELNLFLYQPFNRAVIFSGPDWDESIFNPPISERFVNIPTIHTGNVAGKYYFSFWLSWVKEHIDSFISFDFFKISKQPKVYMNLNRKPHPHRIMLVSALYYNGLFKNGYVSLGKEPVEYRDYFNLKVPILLKDDIGSSPGDQNVFGNVGIANDILSLGVESNWNNHFLNIVSETICGNGNGSIFISEKTLKPIIGRRPFIVFGDYLIYDKLHEWGIDTFDDILGDGYKHREEHKRIEWIINTVKKLANYNNLPKLLYELKPRLESNFERLMYAIKSNEDKIDNLL